MRTLLPLAVVIGLVACDNPNEDTGPTDLNQAPLADAGADLAQPADTRVRLDGSASYDPDGTPVSFHWSFEYVPAGSQLMERTNAFQLNHGPEAALTSFVPDRKGTYVVKLETYDGAKWSQADFVVIEADDPSALPLAEAGKSLELTLGETATVNGLQSSGGGLDLSFQWSLIETPYNSSLSSADIENRDAAEASFTPDVPGLFSLALQVDNGLAVSEPDTVAISVIGDNEPPVADAGMDFNAEDCTWVELDCGGTDPEGADLDYFWTLKSKPAESTLSDDSFYADELRVRDGVQVIEADALGGQHLANPTVWFDEAGTYQVACSVFDGEAWSLPSEITIEVEDRAFNTPPTPNAGPDQELKGEDQTCTRGTWWPYNWSCDSCEAVTADIGIDVTDVDDDPYTVLWERGEGNRSKSEDFTSVEITVTTGQVTPESTGVCTADVYEWTLTAEDCTHEVGRDTVEIEFECCGK